MLVTFLAGACRREPGPVLPPPIAATYESPKNVLLVTIDTLRADHLGCYGYFRDTSPTIDSLAAHGVLFTQCLSTMGTTLPAHLSILTGLYPHQHGHLANRGAGPQYQPSAGRETAPLFFKRAGYRTGGFVSGQTVKRVTGIDAGFEEFTQPPEVDFQNWRDYERPADGATKDAIAWLEREDERPFFAWVHYWDPHEPNEPQPEYEARFERDDPRVAALIDARKGDPARIVERVDKVELARLFFPALVPDFGAAPPEELPMIDREIVLDLYRRYDAEIRYADDQLGVLIDALKRLGKWDDTIVVVVGDHGQSLGQHDWLEHGQVTLDNVHVPLIFRFPGEAIPQPSVVDRVVSCIDVMATVMARLPLAERSAFQAQSEGRDLLSGAFDRPFAFSHRSIAQRALAEHSDEKDRSEVRLGLSEGRWRYYLTGTDGRKEEGVSERDELFDLETDPGELVDVSSSHPEETARLRKRVADIVRRRPFHYPEGDVPLTPEERANLQILEDLGYAGR